jgi:hypothetical protein
MQRSQERSPADWFADARRWYLEEHQGCPHCHGRHCVFRSQWGARVEYHCTECDFSAAHDAATSRYCAQHGESLTLPEH